MHGGGNVVLMNVGGVDGCNARGWKDLVVKCLYGHKLHRTRRILESEVMTDVILEEGATRVHDKDAVVRLGVHICFPYPVQHIIEPGQGPTE